MKSECIIIKVHTSVGVFDIFLPNNEKGVQHVNSIIDSYRDNDIKSLMGSTGEKTKDIILLPKEVLDNSVIQVLYPEQNPHE